MPIPKNVSFVTFDVYGTLIDWETGIYDAFAKEAARDGVEIDRAVLMPMFHEIEREIDDRERYEEALITRAGEEGTEVLRRVDASPLAVLSVALAAAKEAAA